MNRKELEKVLLEILDDGLDCLSQRRQIDYNIKYMIKKLLKENKIKINIES